MIMPATDVHVQVNLYGDLDDTCQLSIRNVTHNYDMQRLANLIRDTTKMPRGSCFEAEPLYDLKLKRDTRQTSCFEVSTFGQCPIML